MLRKDKSLKILEKYLYIRSYESEKQVEGKMLFFTVVLLGICSSYTDIRYHKIKNTHLLLALALGAFSYIYMVISGKMLMTNFLFLNFFIGTTISIIFYVMHVWAAGDAKLFIAYVFLASGLKPPGNLGFPALALLANIFLISLMIVLLLQVKNCLSGSKIMCKKTFLVNIAKRVSNIFLIIFSFGWIIAKILQQIAGYFNPIINIVMLFFCYHLLFKVISVLGEKKKNHIILGLFSVGIILRFLIFPGDFLPEFLFAYSKQILGYTLLFVSINVLFEFAEQKEDYLAFSPLIFTGVLLSYTDFLYLCVQGISLLRGL